MKKVFCFWLPIFCILVLSGCASAPKKEGKTAVATPTQPAAVAPAVPAAFVASTEPAPSGVPRIELAETSFDFGEMVEGKSYMHDFKMKNTGNVPLEIKKVVPG